MPHLIFVGRKSVTQWDNPSDRISHKKKPYQSVLVGHFSGFNSEKLLSRL
ncbi:hypothetical protein Q3H59_001574 [Pantoea sp. SORGH_AS 659]|jgi:hypothetical protein|nr:hypothetical protein [Pantoea sp. SORGH_AS_0659]